MNLRLASVLFLGAACVIATASCSSDDEKSSSTGGSGGTAASGGSAGSAGFAGGVGGTGGTTDPCASDESSALSTVGCNGAKPGAQPDDEYGGKCTPDANSDQGSCKDANHICDYYDVNLGGICVVECTPGATYVSTGGCPAGSRCFDFGDIALCYPDCTGASDCGTGVCDDEGACSSELPPDTDGGTDAGGTDAGASDASGD